MIRTNPTSRPGAVPRVRYAPVLAFVLGFVATGVIPGRADAGGTVCEAYWDQRYDQALKLAEQIVGSDAPMDEKLSAYRCEACTHVARREVEPAKDSILGMLQLDS
ncbi:MAG: hypothetical protein KC729_18645, partial [Candidatus Eisenbacteria bacterium]|nr:hypothetical protein [Candidatus Eisenbacteria bacterium]